LTEDAELDFYSATKRAGERLLAPFGASLSLILLRPFFVYGRGQAASMLIPRLIGSVRSGAPIGLAGTEGMMINPVYAGDAAAALRAALELDGRHVINIAGPEILSLRRVAETIGRAVGREPAFETQAADPHRNLIGDTRQMARLLLPPATPLQRGLPDLL
jgi:nucleoside-diphosphate-sugar epimerase